MRALSALPKNHARLAEHVVQAEQGRIKADLADKGGSGRIKEDQRWSRYFSLQQYTCIFATNSYQQPTYHTPYHLTPGTDTYPTSTSWTISSGRSTRPPRLQPLPCLHQPINLSHNNPPLPQSSTLITAAITDTTATSFYSKPSSQMKAHSSNIRAHAGQTNDKLKTRATCYHDI